MSQSFLDADQVVGYDFETKKLVVCLSEKMALKMIADGWSVIYEKDVGHFIHITLG